MDHVEKLAPATGHVSSAATLSAEVFSIPLNDEAHSFLVYAPLRRAAFVGNSTLVHALQNPDRASAEDLRLFRELRLVDGGPEPNPIQTYHGQPRPTTLTLFMTTTCNLRCSYCYASAGDTPVENMTMEVARRGIDFVVKNAVDLNESGIRLAFHGGGEPTANWSVLTGAFAYAKEQCERNSLTLHSGAATNGVLKQSQIDWIIAHMDSVNISYDGLPEIQDKHRFDIKGQGSSEKVDHTFRCFDRAGFTYGVRVTVTEDAIPYMADSVEFIASRYNPIDIQVEPAYRMGRWRGAASAETESFIAGFREARERVRKYNKSISYSAARIDDLTNHFCGVTGDGFALAPSGNVSSCYEAFSEKQENAQMFFTGTPSTEHHGYDFNMSLIEHLRAQTVEHKPYCSGCFAKWHCAGDCYHKFLSEEGITEFEGSDRCHITRELVKDQILEKIQQSGGWMWSGEVAQHQPLEPENGDQKYERE